MALEIRILSGARAGQVDRFNKPRVVIGRHGSTDLRFDPANDLDVSGRHAEIRVTDGKYVLTDTNSTNGTYVNGERVTGSVELKDGDRIMFGGKGPEVEVATTAKSVEVPPTRVSTSADNHISHKTTEERVAVAVKKQTAGLKRMMLAAGVVVVLGLAAAYWIGQRSSAQQIELLRQQLAQSDSQIDIIQQSIPGDTALVMGMQRQLQTLRDRLPAATTDAERASIQADMAMLEQKIASVGRMDLATINSRNAPAVAIIVSEINGKSAAGTAFAITPEGVLITNRHNVLTAEGRASRLAVKFRDSKDWLPARVVKVASEREGDLALLQMETPGRKYPAVAGIHGSETPAGEGAAVAIIGFPFGYETAQEGEGNDFVAKTTLNGGNVSKRTSTILQIDSFAGHGSSGSPVFTTNGMVTGVVFGGQAEAAGRIVYAVPGDQLRAFLPEAYRSVVRN
jgi:pSer/pThr/pTyr-binding forkhead associated (FHA) protein